MNQLKANIFNDRQDVWPGRVTKAEVEKLHQVWEYGELYQWNGKHSRELHRLRGDSLSALHVAVVFRKYAIVAGIVALSADLTMTTSQGIGLMKLAGDNSRLRRLLAPAEEEKQAFVAAVEEKKQVTVTEMRSRFEAELNPFKSKALLTDLQNAVSEEATACETRLAATQADNHAKSLVLSAESARLHAALEESKQREADHAEATAAAVERDQAQLASIRQVTRGLQELQEQKLAVFHASVAQWSVAELGQWVKELEAGRFAKYTTGFRENSIDGEELSTLEDFKDLKGCGVTSRADRRALWEHIVALLHASANRVIPPAGAAAVAEAKADAKFAEPEVSECVVCMDAPSSALLAPCGHRLCQQCAEALEGSPCPCCRTIVTCVVKKVYN